MEKSDQSRFCESCCENTRDNIVAKEKKPPMAKKQKKELSTDEKIYNFLEKAEKVATFFANRQKAKKKKAKKFKYIYKYDKENLDLMFANIDDSTQTMESIIS